MNINITNVGPSYDAEIADRLEKIGIPACFGNMVLPFLDMAIEISIEDNFKLDQGIASDDLSDIHIKTLVGENSLGELYLTKKGLTNIKEYKDDRITKFVDQAERCFKCQHTSKCYLMTQNYLTAAGLHKD